MKYLLLLLVLVPLNAVGDESAVGDIMEKSPLSLLDAETLAAIDPLNARPPVLTNAQERMLFTRSWEKLSDLIKETPKRLEAIRRASMARDQHKVGNAARFALAAHAAGFGEFTRIGPNSLKEMSLQVYVGIQASIRVPDDRVRHLRVDDSCKGLHVTVLPNAADDWCFQEVLWQVLENYRLDFRLDPNGDFVIFKPPAK